MPEISVLMGIYQGNRDYAAQAIDSVLNQTYEDYEFIICDDGSERDFFQWLEKYCKKDSRIRLLHNQKNEGLASALNKCIACSSGRYLARMDADDISEKTRFEKQAAFLRENREYAFVGCNVRLITKQNIWGERRLEKTPLKKSFLSTSPFVHPTIMIRREIMEQMQGYCESPKVLRAEDYEFFMRLYAAGFRGYNLQEVLFTYREELGICKKHKYRYRLYECGVRYAGFRRMGILKGNLRYVVKPLVVGLFPDVFIKKLHQRRFAYKDGN